MSINKLCQNYLTNAYKHIEERRTLEIHLFLDIILYHVLRFDLLACKFDALVFGLLRKIHNLRLIKKFLYHKKQVL